MQRMQLVLQRSAAQEAALQKLLDDQQDRNSPAYHQWLTPDAFGQQFGPSDQDIQAITAWLQSYGFQVTQVGRGRTTIEFSGTAAQVQQAFHTEIHKYAVNGEEHWANASDPQIPQALSPVVAGVVSLHNFPKQPMHRVAGAFSRSKATGEVRAQNPDYTLPDPNHCQITNYCYLVGPSDFAKIYNVQPLWNQSPAIDGTGQSIAIVGISNINIQDVRDFRNLFGLPANDPQVILNGADPGFVSGAETEADLDVEWSGAVAPGATIKLVAAGSTAATDGVDLSALYIVENDLAPVMSESFGECEMFVGTSGNAFENAIREQAAAEGITFINSSGDEGSARCDTYSGSTPDPATHGLAVSGLASSPYGVAVGGTDFANFGATFKFGVVSPYWSLNNNPQQASVLGYVPETTWNDSCTNGAYVTLGAGSNAEAACNNSQLAGRVVSVGGGGGKSNCTTSNGANVSSCSGGYSKPSWQSAPGVPADGARDIPDVSLFASNGFMDSSYIVCEADRVPGNPSCSLNGLESTFLGVGGTSASAPAFAGIMALVNQSTNSAGQGNANYVLYKLASLQSQKALNCSASATPASGCIFNDVTSGTIAMPCAKGSPNCTVSNSADSYGVLSGYNASAGYDLATGLGSVNAFNLVHGWSQANFSPTTTSLSLNNGIPVSITHGQNVNLNITVSPQAATGDVSLVGSPTGNGSVEMGTFTLQNGVASGSTATLAGGNSYSLRAHYSGDGIYAASDSSPLTVTVAPEPSKTLITIPVFDPNTKKETGNTPSSVAYGTPVGVRVDVGNATATTTFPPQTVCSPMVCPTGSVTVTESLNGGASTILGPTGGFPLNTEGFVEDDSVVLSGGTHHLSANYAGDNSYNPSSGSYTLDVAPAATQMSAPYASFSPPTFIAGTPGQIISLVETSLYTGAEPTGTISFYDGVTQIPGTVSYFGGRGFPGISADLQGTITATFATSGTHQISAKYSGDANYAAVTSPPASISVVYATTSAETANSTNINLGQSVTFTATMTGASKSPPMTGTFQFFGGSLAIPNPVTVTQGTDANGNQTLTATVTANPQYTQIVAASYSGDANYASSTANVFIAVNIPDFSLNAPAGPLLITAGQPASIPISVVPASNLISSVAVSCGGNLPVGYVCAVSPTIVNLSNGANGTVTLSLTPNLITHSSVSAPSVVVKHSGFISISINGFSLFCGFVALLLLVWPVRCLGRSIRVGLVMICVFCFAIGCGSGSSGGGGSGLPPTPQPTTTTVTTSAAKVAMQTPAIFTASVAGSNSPRGSVTFYLNGSYYGTANLVGSSATLTTQIASPGLYVLTAQYAGDALNMPSTSAGVNEAVTGSTVTDVQGQTSTLTRFTNVTVTIQ